jgi:hypothetical protein
VVQVIRVARTCPQCGAAPRIRTVPHVSELFAQEHPDQIVITYQCHVRRCGAIYEIRARDFRFAS